MPPTPLFNNACALQRYLSFFNPIIKWWAMPWLNGKRSATATPSPSGGRIGARSRSNPYTRKLAGDPLRSALAPAPRGALALSALPPVGGRGRVGFYPHIRPSCRECPPALYGEAHRTLAPLDVLLEVPEDRPELLRTRPTSTPLRVIRPRQGHVLGGRYLRLRVRLNLVAFLKPPTPQDVVFPLAFCGFLLPA